MIFTLRVKCIVTEATKRFFKGVWRQYDGSMVPWSPWWRDGKDGGRGENCALISLIINSDSAGDWVDNPCDRGYNYICERDQ